MNEALDLQSPSQLFLHKHNNVNDHPAWMSLHVSPLIIHLVFGKRALFEDGDTVFGTSLDHWLLAFWVTRCLCQTTWEWLHLNVSIKGALCVWKWISLKWQFASSGTGTNSLDTSIQPFFRLSPCFPHHIHQFNGKSEKEEKIWHITGDEPTTDISMQPNPSLVQVVMDG